MENENKKMEEVKTSEEMNQNPEADQPEESEEEVSTKRRILTEIFSWIKVIVIASVLALGLNTFILFNFTVPSESMENTIMVDNKIMSLRCAYWFSEPKRGDIIVFPFPDDPTDTYIKRIIGMPGETIEGREDGFVYINGNKIEEPYVKSDLDEPFGPYEIPKESYFVMGDNRDESADARYWDNKFVKKKDIISKAVLRFSPGFKILK